MRDLPLDDPRWIAVAGRAAAADGRFYYSVRTRRVLPSLLRVGVGEAGKRTLRLREKLHESPSVTDAIYDAGYHSSAQVVGFVEKSAVGLNLPWDIRGTAFQQRVWQALQKIPAGSTVSYTEMAKRAGVPRAVRESEQETKR